jgi:hypothetical protein
VASAEELGRWQGTCTREERHRIAFMASHPQRRSKRGSEGDPTGTSGRGWLGRPLARRGPSMGARGVATRGGTRVSTTLGVRANLGSAAHGTGRRGRARTLRPRGRHAAARARAGPSRSGRRDVPLLFHLPRFDREKLQIFELKCTKVKNSKFVDQRPPYNFYQGWPMF